MVVMTTAEPKAFYQPLGGGRYASTELTRGPWDAGSQHAGPPSALLGFAVEHREGAREDMRVARIALEIMRPVPLETLVATTRVTHASRGVEVVEAELAVEGGPVVVTGRAVRVRVADGAAPEVVPAQVFGDPEALVETPFAFRFAMGYHTAMETRFVAGAFDRPGPATVWFRMRYPLVEGEPVDPLSRVLTAADSGNGVSSVLDFGSYMFINPELSVHLRRYPRGEWVCLDAATTIEADGIGVAATDLHDASGPIGRGTQSLYVAARR